MAHEGASKLWNGAPPPHGVGPSTFQGSAAEMSASSSSAAMPMSYLSSGAPGGMMPPGQMMPHMPMPPPHNNLAMMSHSAAMAQFHGSYMPQASFPPYQQQPPPSSMHMAAAPQQYVYVAVPPHHHMGFAAGGPVPGAPPPPPPPPPPPGHYGMNTSQNLMTAANASSLPPEATMQSSAAGQLGYGAPPRSRPPSLGGPPPSPSHPAPSAALGNLATAAAFAAAAAAAAATPSSSSATAPETKPSADACRSDSGGPATPIYAQTGVALQVDKKNGLVNGVVPQSLSSAAPLSIPPADYSLPSLDDVELTNIVTPHENDVLCGRGGGTNNHPGNEKFRLLVRSQQISYVQAPKRDKPQVSRNIVRAVRAQNPPGRFLQREETTGLWYDIGDIKAREKTAQALREGAPEIREKMMPSASSGDQDETERQDRKKVARKEAGNSKSVDHSPNPGDASTTFPRAISSTSSGTSTAPGLQSVSSVPTGMPGGPLPPQMMMMAIPPGAGLVPGQPHMGAAGGYPPGMHLPMGYNPILVAGGNRPIHHPPGPPQMQMFAPPPMPPPPQYAMHMEHSMANGGYHNTQANHQMSATAERHQALISPAQSSSLPHDGSPKTLGSDQRPRSIMSRKRSCSDKDGQQEQRQEEIDERQPRAQEKSPERPKQAQEQQDPLSSPQSQVKHPSDLSKRLVMAEQIAQRAAAGTLTTALREAEERASLYLEAGLLGIDPEEMNMLLSQGHTEQEIIDHYHASLRSPQQQPTSGDDNSSDDTNLRFKSVACLDGEANVQDTTTPTGQRICRVLGIMGYALEVSHTNNNGKGGAVLKPWGEVKLM